MAVTLTLVEYNGSETPGTSAGSAAATINFGAVDSADLTTTSNPIQAGNHSYFKQLKVNFSGSMTQISNLKVYKSAGAYVTEEGITFSGSITALTPDESDQGWPDIPVTLPGSPNVCLEGLTTGTLDQVDYESTPGYVSGARSDLIGFQEYTGSNSPAGPVNTKTISIVYDRQ